LAQDLLGHPRDHLCEKEAAQSRMPHQRPHSALKRRERERESGLA
jgi:hypothetical protein